MFNDQEGLEILDSMLNGTATIEETVIINGAAVVMIKNILQPKKPAETNSIKVGIMFKRNDATNKQTKISG